MLNVVDAYKPGILRIRERELAFAVLQGGVAKRHVVGDGVEFATARDF